MNEQSNLVLIHVDHIFPHPNNPRKTIGDIKELAASIKAKGIMQNLTVVPRGSSKPQQYTVIIGHRRLAAARFAGLTHVPCVVTDMTERDQLGTMLLENIQRSDLNAYEQAQGFQMMFDLGETVESISDKTGFSKATVRRRLKMAELDSRTMQEISGRQLNLTDFDKLSEIEDIGERNRVLCYIGGANFDSQVYQAVKKQNIAKRLPGIKAEIKKLKAKKLKYSETYNGNYTCIGNKLKISEYEDGEFTKQAGKRTEQLFYLLEEQYNETALYVKVQRKIERRPKKVIEREKYVAETRKTLEQMEADHRVLRRRFALSVSLTKRNIDSMLRGAVVAMGMKSAAWYSVGVSLVADALDIDYDSMPYNNRFSRLVEALLCADESCYAAIIYNMYGDGDNTSYIGGMSTEFPTFAPNPRLDALYQYLISLGYEMCDDERMLRDGTHPLFVDKDKPVEVEEQQFGDFEEDEK
ncbi:MAG: ParB/RepB/Spo0J family partition protein [Clostridia bacterium]|nr:ParB/RepB/Spo0J family partition protein [Clostridia bacterium]